MILRVILISVMLTAIPSCSNKEDPLTDCLESVGRRPCDSKSIKYNANSKMCGCQTKHRGWIKWEVAN